MDLFRAYAGFAENRLPERVHEAPINKIYRSEIVGYISRDSMAIEAWEKPIKTKSEDPEEKKAKKRGRPKKGEECTKEPAGLTADSR